MGHQPHKRTTIHVALAAILAIATGLGAMPVFAGASEDWCPIIEEHLDPKIEDGRVVIKDGVDWHAFGEDLRENLDPGQSFSGFVYCGPGGAIKIKLVVKKNGGGTGSTGTGGWDIGIGVGGNGTDTTAPGAGTGGAKTGGCGIGIGGNGTHPSHPNGGEGTGTGKKGTGIVRRRRRVDRRHGRQRNGNEYLDWLRPRHRDRHRWQGRHGHGEGWRRR